MDWARDGGAGEGAPREGTSLRVLAVGLVISVREEEAWVEVEPRASLGPAYLAWKRERFVLRGEFVESVVGTRSSASAGAGLGGGEMKATFFVTSEAAAVDIVPVVLRELRPAESGSVRRREGSGESVRGRVSCASGVGVEAAGGVGPSVEDEWERESGFREEEGGVGGGMSATGGHGGSFGSSTLGLGSTSLSLLWPRCVNLERNEYVRRLQTMSYLERSAFIALIAERRKVVTES